MKTCRLPLLLAAAIALGGCAGARQDFTLQNLWENTKSAVSTAYQKTKKTVSSAFSSGQDQMASPTPAWQTAPPPEPAPVPEDRFPAKSARTSEQTPSSQESRNLSPITEHEVRGSGASQLLLIPREKLTPDETRQRIAEIDRTLPHEKDTSLRRRLIVEKARFQQTLDCMQEKETIIREMERLRSRLRTLQKRLSEIQSSRK